MELMAELAAEEAVAPPSSHAGSKRKWGEMVVEPVVSPATTVDGMLHIFSCNKLFLARTLKDLHHCLRHDREVTEMGTEYCARCAVADKLNRSAFDHMTTCTAGGDVTKCGGCAIMRAIKMLFAALETTMGHMQYKACQEFGVASVPILNGMLPSGLIREIITIARDEEAERAGGAERVGGQAGGQPEGAERASLFVYDPY